MELDRDRTIPGRVETEEGFIPYRRVIAEHGVFEAPVRVRVVRTPRRRSRVHPERNAAGGYVYALPGGGVLR